MKFLKYVYQLLSEIAEVRRAALAKNPVIFWY